MNRISHRLRRFYDQLRFEGLRYPFFRLKFLAAELRDFSPDYCWADLAIWSMGPEYCPEGVTLKNLRGSGHECAKDSLGGACWCGKFVDGKAEEC